MSRETREIYNARWRKFRLKILARDNYLCQIKGPKCTQVATEVDHIIGWRWGGAILDEDNARASCKPCNAGRTWHPNRPRNPSQEW